MVVVCLKPTFGTGDDLKKLFCLRGTFQFCLALPLGHPEDGVITIGIDCLVMETLLPAESEGMDDG